MQVLAKNINFVFDFINMYMKRICLILKYIAVMSTVVALSACSKSKPYRIEAQTVEPVEIVRFDTALMQYVQHFDSTEYQELTPLQNDWWNVYNRRILGLTDAPLFRDGLTAFMSDEKISSLYTDAVNRYADVTDLEKQLSQMLARYKTLFPNRPCPVVQMHVSGLNQSVVTVGPLVSVSIDCYLGVDYPLYPKRYHKYELRRHERNRILPDIAEVLLRNAIPVNARGTMLDAIVYEGRIAYLMSGLLDTDSPDVLFAFTDEETAWLAENEAAVWTTVVDKKHLFSTNGQLIQRYIAPAPFTSILSQDAPGQTGRWLGWRIVSKFVQETGFSPERLATDKISAHDVLRISHYEGK